MEGTRTKEQRIATAFAPQLELCDRLLDEAWSTRPTRRETDSEARAVLAAILRRSIDTYDATIRLCRAGFPDQALMLVRSLFEDEVSACWLCVPEKRDIGLARLRDQADYQVLLSNDAIRKYPHRFLIAADDHADLEPRRKEFEKAFGTYGEKAWFGSLYAALDDIAPLIPELGGNVETLRVYYAVVHRHANLHLHSTSLGVRGALDSYDERDGYDSLNLDVSLRAAFSCLVAIAHVVARELGHDRTRLSELTTEAEHVFLDLTPSLRGKIGRNDPCWCGSGKKLKKCHGD